jgi:hypothetical protein
MPRECGFKEAQSALLTSRDDHQHAEVAVSRSIAVSERTHLSIPVVLPMKRAPVYFRLLCGDWSH